MPGRGIDVTGYKVENSGVIEILLGEAKVSSQKQNPPKVSDDIYDEQIKYTNTNKDYLKRRLANYSKKLDTEDAANITLVLLAIETGINNIYQLVYGCCLVRDTSCYASADFGKMKTNQKLFSPDRINYIIPVFDKPIEDVVDLFYNEVDKQING